MTKAKVLSDPNPLISRSLPIIILSVLAGLIVYPEAVSKVFVAVLTRSDSSHGVFVPVLSAYFLWTVKDRIQSTRIHYSWAGILLLVICLIPPLAHIGSFQFQFIAFIGFICALVYVLLGKEMFKTVAFPICFLITMTPLPTVWYDNIANITRIIAFGGSLKIISLLGIPHMKVGWDIELPNAILNVAIACSGIRYLVSFVVFGLAYAYLFKSSTRTRIVTVLATIPISLFASICRLTIIFTMTYWVSPFWSHHRPHIVLSWFVFFTILFTSIYIDQRVHERFEQPKKEGLEAIGDRQKAMGERL